MHKFNGGLFGEGDAVVDLGVLSEEPAWRGFDCTSIARSGETGRMKSGTKDEVS